MNKKEMKKVLRRTARPVNLDLFNTVGFNDEELKLMKYLYVDKIRNQYWICDELGVSLSTLANIHNNCINQIISYFYYEKFNDENGENSLFKKFFVL